MDIEGDTLHIIYIYRYIIYHILYISYTIDCYRIYISYHIYDVYEGHIAISSYLILSSSGPPDVELVRDPGRRGGAAHREPHGRGADVGAEAVPLLKIHAKSIKNHLKTIENDGK